jgi:hypothetical protein
VGFRDEQEAARAHRDALEREVAFLRARSDRRGRAWVPPALAALGAAVLASLVTFAVVRYRDPRPDYARALADANEAYLTARRDSAAARAQLEHERTWAAREPPSGGLADDYRADWSRPGTASASWSAEVTERIGDARAGLGARCTITLEQTEARAPHDIPPCDVRVVCDDLVVYPAPGETSRANCWLESSGRFGVFDLSAEANTRRVTARNGAVRVDDGPVGTWSFAF